MQTINFDEALNRLDGDREIYAELITAFLADSQQDITLLLKAVDSSDWSTAAYHVHKIKGAALTLGAERLSANTELIESQLRNNQQPEVKELIVEIKTQYAETVERLIELHQAL